MKEFFKNLTFVEWMVVLAIICIMVAVISTGSNDHQDYKTDFLTGTRTWTDAEGRKMMQSSNGTVIELSPKGK